MKINLLFLSLLLISGQCFAKDLCSGMLDTPKGKLVFSKAYKNQNIHALDEKHLQFGFESEYVKTEADALLKAYMPDPSVYGLNKHDWLAMNHTERLNFLTDKSNDIFPYRKPGKLVKITDDVDLYEALPNSLIYDSGNFEIVLPPLDRVEELASKIKTINNKLGTGSMQVTISSPRESFFQFNANPSYPLRQIDDLSSEFIENSFNSNMGYYNFFNDFDTLQKMRSGFKRYLDNPNELTAKSFAHPWLGPSNKQRNDKLEKLLKKHASGQMSSVDELDDISSIIDSHKFIGGTVYRPDVAWSKSRMASEVRDCHKNPACIEDRLRREVLFHMVGKEKLKDAAKLKPFDRAKVFNSMNNDVKLMLERTFPKYGNYSADTTSVYMNFVWPLREWDQHINLLNKPELSQRVASAQKKYLNFLEENAKKLKNNQITPEELKPLIQGELNRFSVESGLIDAFDDFYQKIIGTDIDLVDFIKLTKLMQIWFQVKYA
jgi:hypothetical protein